MIAAPSSLAQAFEQTHSSLFDLSSEAPSTKAMVEYRDDPVGFCVNVLGIPRYRIQWSLNPGFIDANGVFTRKCLVCGGDGRSSDNKQCEACNGRGAMGWDGTPDPLVSMLNGLRDSMDVCVEAATGTQKSYTCACALLWFIACWEGARVFTFAFVEAQLRAYMWKEVRELWPRFKAVFPTAELLDLEIRMRGGQDNSWGAKGVSVKKRAGEEVAVAAQGMHAAHMLLIYEEMPAIDWGTVIAGENTCTAPHNLRLGVGNPDHQLDSLHLFGYDELTGLPRSDIKCIRISALDHPNVVCNDAEIVPGAASMKSVDRRRTKRGPSDRLYKSRVRGISPSEAADALIKLEWIQAAEQRWLDENDKRILTGGGRAKRALGVDVANSPSGDEAAIVEGVGAYLETIETFPCDNANNLGFDVHLRMKEKRIADEHVGVDDVGVGAGTINELKRLEHYVHSLGGGDKAFGRIGAHGEPDTEQYDNWRSQGYWVLREDLREGRIALPPHPSLRMQLLVPRWGTEASKIWVESKNDIKDRTPGRLSPNEADAVMYWNWVRPRDVLVTALPKRELTQAERLRKEFEELDRQEREHYHHNDEPAMRERYGSVIRQ